MSLDKFISQIKNESVAMQSLYRVDFTLPKVFGGRSVLSRVYSKLDSSFYEQLEPLSLLCKTTQFPGVSVGTAPIHTYSVDKSYAYSRDTPETIPFTFYVDQSFAVKNFFDRWVDSIHSLRSFHVAYYHDYITDVRITQLDRAGNDVYTIVLRDAFPKIVTPMPLDYAATNSPHELTVDFSYWYWTLEGADRTISLHDKDLKQFAADWINNNFSKTTVINGVRQSVIKYGDLVQGQIRQISDGVISGIF